jgi:hypothetical protein
MLAENLLTIRQEFKQIPYQGAVREEGSICHGFKLLKWASSDDARAIPEASDIQCLQDALVTINAPATAFFTVGCEKALNKTERGFWAKGYLEFAFNFREFAEDAQWYFKLFFDFTALIAERKYEEPIQFFWELDGANFTRANFIGYSAAVWFTTDVLNSAEEAKDVWCSGVRLFAEFLAGTPAQGNQMVFPPAA